MENTIWISSNIENIQVGDTITVWNEGISFWPEESYFQPSSTPGTWYPNCQPLSIKAGDTLIINTKSQDAVSFYHFPAGVSQQEIQEYQVDADSFHEKLSQWVYTLTTGWSITEVRTRVQTIAKDIVSRLPNPRKWKITSDISYSLRVGSKQVFWKWWQMLEIQENRYLLWREDAQWNSQEQWNIEVTPKDFDKLFSPYLESIPLSF